MSDSVCHVVGSGSTCRYWQWLVRMTDCRVTWFIMLAMIILGAPQCNGSLWFQFSKAWYIHVCQTLSSKWCHAHVHIFAFPESQNYRALQVTCQRLEAWMSSYGENHHASASLNLFTAAPNLIKVLHNLVRRPHLQPSLFLFPISIDK